MSKYDNEALDSLGDKVIEKCAKLIQTVTKAKETGWDEVIPETQTPNALFETLDEMSAVEEAISKFQHNVFTHQITFREKK